MEVTLRKAHSLSKALLEQVRKTPLARTVTVSIYEDVEASDAATEAGEKLVAAVADGIKCIDAAYAIRLSIAKANLAAGVDGLLNEKARLDAGEKLLSQAVDGSSDHSYTSAVDPAIARQKMDALKVRAAQPDKGYGVTEELTVKVATPEVTADLSTNLATMRRRKTEIADELLGLNTSTRVSLSPDVVTLLQRYNLI